MVEVNCPFCGGSGRLGEPPNRGICPGCGGTGKIQIEAAPEEPSPPAQPSEPDPVA